MAAAWEATEPKQVAHFGPSKRRVWVASVLHLTEQYPCHQTYRRGYWSDGEHRTSAAALSCAEREARRRNREEN